MLKSLALALSAMRTRRALRALRTVALSRFAEITEQDDDRRAIADNLADLHAALSPA